MRTAALPVVGSGTLRHRTLPTLTSPIRGSTFQVPSCTRQEKIRHTLKVKRNQSRALVCKEEKNPWMETASVHAVFKGHESRYVSEQ